MTSNGHHQRVKVHPATESERIRGVGKQPLWCHVKGYYDRDQRKLFTLVTLPIRFDDQGHPSDLRWSPLEGAWVTRLDFRFEGRVFRYPIGPIWLVRGQPLHLALHHMKLLNRFGLDVLDR